MPSLDWIPLKMPLQGPAPAWLLGSTGWTIWHFDHPSFYRPWFGVRPDGKTICGSDGNGFDDIDAAMDATRAAYVKGLLVE